MGEYVLPFKRDFFLTAEQAGKFPYAEKYLVTEIAEQMNKLRNTDMTKKISGAEIFRYIMAEGLASQTFYGGGSVLVEPSTVTG